MIRRLIKNVERSLAKKITTWVMVTLLLLIVFIIAGAQWITTDFYQKHLKNEVEERLSAHVSLLSTTRDEDIFRYLNQLETGKNSNLLITDQAFQPIYISENVSVEEKEKYLVFLNNNQQDISSRHQITHLDEVDTSMAFHIPHLWGTAQIDDQAGNTIGYVFIDQDTGELNSARLNLLLLLLFMGALTFVVGYAFILYLTRKISNPLNEISSRTQDIADGDFDIVVDVKSNDEVGQLGGNIQEMTKQLKEFRDSRRQFISHISHDLRTPITYIKGYSALMKDAGQVDAGTWRRNMQVIYEEAKRMENLVSDLFLLTKLQEGKIQLQVEEVCVHEWLPPLFKSRAIMFDQKQIHSSIHIDASLKEKTIHLDAFRMEQALINLMENAIRYTEVSGEIKLSCYFEDTMLVFEISDTGEGMDQEELDLIWERFYKADTSRSRDDSGTGLGLAIVKEIVEAHQGKVKVESEKGVGTTFYIFIPWS
ncbi:two-component sensor histidine kinase [Salipaludibacillus keqinensis]|uniref:histidine kinase n=1 Tax=Salipaludibacillus keqinensis TaxID=2045207 RepID=A0A323TH96_9BACI|nr:HAMP domain-containing sensor histidine kinase [Salipaludibacillus keqinensis]PYZ91963.1 two-component sensor histidine kinase [Salipaludibacillus keqinensis]